LNQLIHFSFVYTEPLLPTRDVKRDLRGKSDFFQSGNYHFPRPMERSITVPLLITPGAVKRPVIPSLSNQYQS